MPSKWQNYRMYWTPTPSGFWYLHRKDQQVLKVASTQHENSIQIILSWYYGMSARVLTGYEIQDWTGRSTSPSSLDIDKEYNNTILAQYAYDAAMRTQYKCPTGEQRKRSINFKTSSLSKTKFANSRLPSISYSSSKVNILKFCGKGADAVLSSLKRYRKL